MAAEGLFEKTDDLKSVYIRYPGKNVNFLGIKIHWIILNIIIVAIQSLKIIVKERPNIIVSTGADVTIPICYLGKFLNVKIFFIESFSRVNDLSPTGKIVYPIADLFLVQWKRLTKKYSKAKYWGSVL